MADLMTFTDDEISVALEDLPLGQRMVYKSDFALSTDDWNVLETVLSFLPPFKDATGSLYPTLSAI